METPLRNPDYNLRVRIQGDGLDVRRVPCRVYLPERAPGRVVLRFSPNRRQAQQLVPIFECAVEGASTDLAGVRTQVQARRVYLQGLVSTHWGAQIEETTLEGEPTDLKVMQGFPTRIDTLRGKTAGSFWLTPSLLLTPSKIVERSYTGEVKVQTVRRFQFPLLKGLQLSFDTHFRSTKNEAGDVVTFSELVGEFELLGERQAIQKVDDVTLHALDDFLLIVSFAERWRCACVGWDAADSRGRTRYFRRDISTPPPPEEHTLNNTLVDIADFEQFVRSAHARFTAELNPLVRQALQYAIYREGRTLEHSFLTLYAALETLLLYFRHVHQLHRVLDPRAWDSVAKSLRSTLKTDPNLVRNKDARRLIYEKLPELNRVSFGTVFRRFCEEYKVDLRDLWPVLRGSSGVSLSDIRNRLVHGEHFSPTQMVPLIVADQHLRWVVERMILRFLGWPIVRSKVNGDFLARNMRSYQGWDEHRKALSP